MSMIGEQEKPRIWLPLIVILLAAFALRFIFMVGMEGSDDLNYAGFARQIAEGSYQVTDYFQGLRMGILLPTAAGYWLFGVHTATTIWVSMFCSLLGVLVVFLIGRELFGASAGLWAAMVYAVFPVDVVGAGVLGPDGPVATLTALAFFLVLYGERTPNGGKAALAFAGSGFLLGVAHLCKETAVLPGLILVLYGLIRRRRLLFYFITAAAAASVILAEGFYYLASTGDFLHRVHVVASWNHALADGMLAPRLASLWEYPRSMFLSIEEFGIFWYLLFGAAVWALAVRLKRAWVVALWVLPLWLYLQFGFSSFKQLTFPAHVPRYLTLMTIPAAALIGAMLAYLHGRRRWVGLSVLCAITLASSLFFCGLNAALAESRSWNSRQVAERLRELPKRPTFVLLGRPVVEWCVLPDKLDIRGLYRKHDPATGADTEPLPLPDLAGSYVVVDNRLITFVKERQELSLPDYLVAVPKSWTIAAEVRNDFSGLKYLPIRTVRWTLQKQLLPGFIASRFAHTLGNITDHNECVIYHVPEKSGSS